MSEILSELLVVKSKYLTILFVVIFGISSCFILIELLILEMVSESNIVS